MPLRPADLFTPFRPVASFTRPSRPLLHRPAMPPKRLSKALAGASSDEDYADLADPPFPPHGEAPSPRAKAKKAKKAPAATSSQPGSGDLVQDGWVSMHNDGVPFVMWKCVWFFFLRVCAHVPFLEPLFRLRPPIARPSAVARRVEEWVFHPDRGPNVWEIRGLGWQTAPLASLVVREAPGRRGTRTFSLPSRPRSLSQTLPPSSHRRYGEPAYSGKVAAFDLVRKQRCQRNKGGACTREAAPS